eukprot:1748282-Rhodomonas_salina.2
MARRGVMLPGGRRGGVRKYLRKPLRFHVLHRPDSERFGDFGEEGGRKGVGKRVPGADGGGSALRNQME